MKITAIKAQVKSKDRVSVFVDGKYSFSLNLDELVKHNIKKDLVLDDADLKKLIKISEDGKTKQRALEWVLRRPHSVKEFTDYAYRKKIEEDLRAEIIEYFIERGYLDDEKFALWFAENRRNKNKSNREISSELAAKGIKRSIIDIALNNLDGEREALQKLYDKNKHKTKYQDEQKFRQYLYSKGFSYELIKELFEAKR